MAKNACWQEIPTELSLERFEEFILPHLTLGSRGPLPKLPLHALFNYILKLLYLGCQWKELPIEKDATGRREIHHVRMCVQVRLACSAGDRPAGVKVRAP